MEQVHAIKRALDDRKHQHLNPTWQDIAVLESINAALKPVAEFTDVLSNEKVVTASSVRPVLRLLTNDLLDPSPEDSELTKNIKHHCLGGEIQRFRRAKKQLRWILDTGIILMRKILETNSSKK